MAKPFHPENRIARLRVAQQKLQQAEAEYARAAAQYHNLEGLLRKQLKQQLIDHSEAPVKADGHLRYKSTTETITTPLKCSRKVDEGRTRTGNARLVDKAAMKFNSKSSSVVAKTGWQQPGVSALKKCSVDQAGGREQLQNGALRRRIQQCHANVNSLALLSDKPVAERKKFLKQLDKVNSESWKLLKVHIPLIGNLEAPPK